MFRSRKIFCAIRRSLVLVCVCLALNGETKPDAVGVVLCGPESGHCGAGATAPVQPVFQLAQRRGRRGVSEEEEFWKRSFPHWVRRYRSGSRAWLTPDDDMAHYIRAAVKDKGDAFWKRVDPQGFWRRTVAEADEKDMKKTDEAPGNAESNLDTGKRVDRLSEDDSPAPEERMAGYPNKQRRRQEGLTRPEFNPTGW